METRTQGCSPSPFLQVVKVKLAETFHPFIKQSGPDFTLKQWENLSTKKVQKEEKEEKNNQDVSMLKSVKQGRTNIFLG